MPAPREQSETDHELDPAMTVVAWVLTGIVIVFLVLELVFAFVTMGSTGGCGTTQRCDIDRARTGQWIALAGPVLIGIPAATVAVLRVRQRRRPWVWLVLGWFAMTAVLLTGTAMLAMSVGLDAT